MQRWACCLPRLCKKWQDKRGRQHHLPRSSCHVLHIRAKCLFLFLGELTTGQAPHFSTTLPLAPSASVRLCGRSTLENEAGNEKAENEIRYGYEK